MVLALLKGQCDGKGWGRDKRPELRGQRETREAAELQPTKPSAPGPPWMRMYAFMSLLPLSYPLCFWGNEVVQKLSTCGPEPAAPSIIWELVRDANFQPHPVPRPREAETLRVNSAGRKGVKHDFR